MVRDGGEARVSVEAPRRSRRIAQNQWAFFPLYPTLVKLLMLAVGWAYPLAAVVVSTICGAFAVSLMHTHLARTASRFLATACTASLCAFMSAPILQVAYTESLALLLITLAIRYLDSDSSFGWLALRS